MGSPGTSTRNSPNLESLIEEDRQRADVVGATVAVFDRDGMPTGMSFGCADLARNEVVTPDTVFRAASISKLCTSVLVLQEVDAGRVALDDPINRFLDASTWVRDKHGRPAEVTVRHLLTHSSGLPVSWRGLEFGNPLVRHLIGGIRPPRTLHDVVAGTRTVRPAGARFVYANGGMSLLGYAIARLHDRPFEDLIRERVLQPLGMSHSRFTVDDGGPGVATAYGGLFGGAGRKPAPVTRNFTGPAGSLSTTARELSRLGQMVLRDGELDGRRLLSPALLSEATRMQMRNHPELDAGWGLGCSVSSLRGRRQVGHSGDLPGVETTLAIWPDEGFGVVILTNGGDKAFVHRLRDRIFEDTLHLQPEPIPGSPQGVPANLYQSWQAFTHRVVGSYRMVDSAPPGVLTRALAMMTRLKLVHVGDGVLALDRVGPEIMRLYPDGEVGRYRVAHPYCNGARAVIEEGRDGADLWYATFHARRTD